MVKTKVIFRCQSCGYESMKWLGRCPECSEWNTMSEEIERKEVHRARLVPFTGDTSPQSISKINASSVRRVITGIGEFDRILGGGIVPGSLILIGGAPGIGKSTLLMQVAHRLSTRPDLEGASASSGRVLYVSGEESVQQAKIRAMRLEADAEKLYVVSETNLEIIAKHIEMLKPQFVIIDSIQTVYKDSLPGAPGTVSQVRECTVELLRIAKDRDISIFISGQVTKDGSIAGPRVLEHIVDTVLYFEGNSQHMYRILRAYKNRFGSTNEIGVFIMKEKGLCEVENPSEIFLSERPVGASGSVVIGSLEGSRPLLIELQALVSPANFTQPQRRAIGVDYNRLSLLLAVLEKRLGMHLGMQDVFVNVVGGIEVDEPSTDLGILCAVASAFRNAPVDPKTVVMGEVGLAGEVRAVNFIEKRIKEAAKLGFGHCVIPQGNLSGLKIKDKIDLIGVGNVKDALSILLGTSTRKRK
ncbi:MAG: DNA repair protein RadA [bacterium]